MSAPTSAELEDFIARAEQVHAAVAGLASGEVAPEETTDLLHSLEKRQPVQVAPEVAAYRAEQAAAAEEARKRKGIPGQGARKGYLYFCRGCFREYDLEPKADQKAPDGRWKCAHCGSSPLITREERMVELQAKVQALQDTKEERRKRRERFAKWKEEKQRKERMVILTNGEEAKTSDDAPAGGLGTKYADWDLWEPSSDEDQSAPQQPDAPEFAAMKLDIEQREAKKQAARVISEKANERGHEAIKRKDYLAAVEAYSQAVDATRSEKSYYTNRCLALIHSFDYARAIKDAETAINIFECFEEEHVRYTSDYKNMKIVLKAFLRKARAELAVNSLPAARASLASAVATVAKIYASKDRQAGEYEKARKAELAEIEKMRQEAEEKEAFQKEEREMVAAQPVGSAGEEESVEKQVRQSGGPDVEQITTLISSLTASTYALLSSSTPSAPSSSSPAASFSLLQPALQFLTQAMDSDGNKERLVAHVDSRHCVEALVKLAKRVVQPAAAKPAAATNASVAAIPSPLPDFAPLTARLALSSASRTANLIAWRERDGFSSLGRWLTQMLHAMPSSELVPHPVVDQLLRIVAGLTDRPRGREYLASASHAPVLIDLVLHTLDSAKSSSTGASRLQASNLLANLAYQPTLRTWVCQQENLKKLDAIYTAVSGLLTSCSLTSSTQSSASTSPHLLSSGLSTLINLFGSQACRLRFIESGSSAENAECESSSSSSTSPIHVLLDGLHSLTKRWVELKYSVIARTPLAEVSEKVLSILMNLCVDDFANAAVFTRILPGTLKELVNLVDQPARSADPNGKAGRDSIKSVLPPVLIERALGVLTRGLRREHTSASSPLVPGAPALPPHPRPLRTGFKEAGGLDVVMRVLTMWQWANEEEGVSEESVLAKLQASDAAAAESDSASSSASAAAAASPAAAFQYTRLTLEHASVCLAVCMTQDTVAAKQAAAFTFQGISGLTTLVSLLSETKRKNIAGNACLCIDSLCAVPELLTRPELSAALDALLVLLKDPAAKAAHQNAAKAAILIGRTENNAERWKKMRGVEIIATVLKMK